MLLENISLEVIISVVFGFKSHIAWRQLLRCLNVVVDLEIDTALQLSALTCQLLWIERNVLIACGACCHRHKIRHPCGAAQRTATRANATDASSLLACANLLHFHTNLKHFSQHLNQLAEIHTLIGNVVEDSLVAIALILHVALRNTRRISTPGFRLAFFIWSFTKLPIIDTRPMSWPGLASTATMSPTSSGKCALLR